MLAAGMAIRAITFDWGDTLAANYGQPYAFAHRRALLELERRLRAHGLRPPGDWRERFEDDFQRQWRESADPQRNPEHRELDVAATLDEELRRAGGDPADPGCRAAVEAFCASCIEVVTAFDGAGEALAALKHAGYRIGILSHVAWPGPSCRAWFARRGWDRWIDFYSFSSDVGWIKPDPRHYRHALDQAGCAAGELLHVGDHPERDIDAARRFGFRTCLRLTEGVYPRERVQACHPDLIVVHVREVAALVGDLR